MWQNPDVETALVENTPTQPYRHLLSLIAMPFREKSLTETVRMGKSSMSVLKTDGVQCDSRHLKVILDIYILLHSV